MIVETFGVARDGEAFNTMLDDIKEVNILDDKILILRNDDSEDVDIYDAYDKHKIYLLNDEGKTLRVVHDYRHNK